jgi:hypothetical protein
MNSEVSAAVNFKIKISWDVTFSSFVEKEESAAFIFMEEEDGGSRLLQIVGVLLQNYITSYARRS